MPQNTIDINGTSTLLIVEHYVDRVLFVVSQLGKVGNLIQASIPPTAPLLPADNESNIPPPSPAVHLTPLLGSASSEHASTLHSLYTSQIATLVWSIEAERSLDPIRKSVVVGVALKKLDEAEERAQFVQIMAAVRDILSQQ